MSILKRSSLVVLAALLLSTAWSNEAAAQFQIGPRVGIGVADFEDIYIGADARFSVGQLPVQINPAVDYYLLDVDDVSLFHVTVNGLYHFGFDNQLFTPYAGGGLSLAAVSNDVTDDTSTELGLNVVGGAIFQLQTLQPFVQAELNLGSDAELYGITGGLLFTLGG